MLAAFLSAGAGINHGTASQRVEARGNGRIGPPIILAEIAMFLGKLPARQ